MNNTKMTNGADVPILTAEYRNWLDELKQRYRSTQVKAAIEVNHALIEFYWQLGKDISLKYSGKSYGARFYERLSADLQLMLPGATGLSKGNIIYCQRFYELYSSGQIVPQLVEQSSQIPLSTNTNLSSDILTSPTRNKHLPQNVTNAPVTVPFQFLFQIPWGHHRLIIDKCKGKVEEALFYVRKTLENNWSRNVLLNWISSNLYARNGKALTNFTSTLPSPDGDLAQQLTKDPYIFSVQGLSEHYNETELKKAMIGNMESLLLELGKGFAFVGREKVIEVCGEEKIIDLLFYFIPQHRYVAVEVKTGEFTPADLGQLQGYVAACDIALNGPADNPALGLLVCKGKNAPLVRFLLGKSDMPLGVSDYELTRVLPENFKSDIPSVEELEAELQRFIPVEKRDIDSNEGPQKTHP